MYRIFFLLTSLFPSIAFASSIYNIIDLAISFFQALVPLFFWIAVLVFFWGIVKFIAHADDPKQVEEGKQIIIWGLVGIFVLVTLWGIIGFIQETILPNQFVNTDGFVPKVPDKLPTF